MGEQIPRDNTQWNLCDGKINETIKHFVLLFFLGLLKEDPWYGKLSPQTEPDNP